MYWVHNMATATNVTNYQIYIQAPSNPMGATPISTALARAQVSRWQAEREAQERAEDEVRRQLQAYPTTWLLCGRAQSCGRWTRSGPILTSAPGRS